MGPIEVPVLGGAPKSGVNRYPFNAVGPLPHYRSGVPGKYCFPSVTFWSFITNVKTYCNYILREMYYALIEPQACSHGVA